MFQCELHKVINDGNKCLLQSLASHSTLLLLSLPVNMALRISFVNPIYDRRSNVFWCFEWNNLPYRTPTRLICLMSQTHRFSFLSIPKIQPIMVSSIYTYIYVYIYREREVLVFVSIHRWPYKYIYLYICECLLSSRNFGCLNANHHIFVTYLSFLTR